MSHKAADRPSRAAAQRYAEPFQWHQRLQKRHGLHDRNKSQAPGKRPAANRGKGSKPPSFDNQDPRLMDAYRYLYFYLHDLEDTQEMDGPSPTYHINDTPALANQGGGFAYQKTAIYDLVEREKRMKKANDNYIARVRNEREAQRRRELERKRQRALQRKMRAEANARRGPPKELEFVITERPKPIFFDSIGKVDNKGFDPQSLVVSKNTLFFDKVKTPDYEFKIRKTDIRHDITFTLPKENNRQSFDDIRDYDHTYDRNRKMEDDALSEKARKKREKKLRQKAKKRQQLQNNYNTNLMNGNNKQEVDNKRIVDVAEEEKEITKDMKAENEKHKQHQEEEEEMKELKALKDLLQKGFVNRAVYDERRARLLADLKMKRDLARKVRLQRAKEEAEEREKWERIRLREELRRLADPFRRKTDDEGNSSKNDLSEASDDVGKARDEDERDRLVALLEKKRALFAAKEHKPRRRNKTQNRCDFTLENGRVEECEENARNLIDALVLSDHRATMSVGHSSVYDVRLDCMADLSHVLALSGKQASQMTEKKEIDPSDIVHTREAMHYIERVAAKDPSLVKKFVKQIKKERKMRSQQQRAIQERLLALYAC